MLNVPSVVRQTNMSKKFPYKTFASLCESYIAEVSTSLNIVQQKPGGKQVVQFLHKEQGLAHDQKYSPTSKISWSDLKGAYRGAWVIVIGSQAVGAIKASGGTTGDYEAVAVDPSTGELRKLRDGRGGNILDFLKPMLGKFVSYYVGTNTTTVKDKQRKRQELNKEPGATAVTQDTIVKKFRPLWVKAMNSAIADVKGMAATMIKNDSYDKAEKKINLLRKLQSAIEAIEAGSEDIPDSIRTAVSSGILMAAAHHYPEQTGEIERSRYGGSYSANNQEGPRQLLADIAAGDTAKLGTILAFFKRSLMAV